MARKQKQQKTSFDPAFHGSDHDLVPDPQKNDGKTFQTEGAGCYGGVAKDTPVKRIHNLFLQHPKEHFTSREIAKAIGVRHGEVKKPLLLARQLRLIEKVQDSKHAMYKAGKSL